MKRRKHAFDFKQFTVEQGQCAMKVTTDACLLGAITPVEKANTLLDIGTGTGLLSLMVAQRSDADIVAVELDDDASQQAAHNFKQSPWADRLSLHNSSIQTFAESATTPFDVIICNPPFFENCYKAPEQRRSQARHTDTLSFQALSQAIATLLNKTGQAWVLLPVDFSQLFCQQALAQGLSLTQRINVRSSDQHNPHRHIVVIEHTATPLKESTMTLYNKHPQYSAEFTALMTPYYLFL